MGREIIKLALGTTDVTAITPDNISDAISDSARHEVVIAQLFNPINDFIDQGVNKVVIPNYKNYIAVSSNMGESTSISPSSFSYDGTTVTLTKLGIRIEITNEAKKSAARDLLSDALYMGAKEYAIELDKQAETVLLNLNVGSISSWDGGTLGTVTAGQSPIVEILTVGAGTIDSVDYYDGKVLLAASIAAGTVTFSYSNDRRVKDATGKGTLTITDILDLKSTMNESTIYPDMLLINASDMTNFAKDTAQTNLFSYLLAKPGVTGNIGRILDMNVVTSGILPKGAAILVDSTKTGYDVTSRPLKGYEDDRPEIDSVWYHLWAMKGYAMYSTLSVGIITNLKVGTYQAADL